MKFNVFRISVSLIDTKDKGGFPLITTSSNLAGAENFLFLSKQKILNEDYHQSLTCRGHSPGLIKTVQSIY
ncbi:hypothetical protein GCM10007103_13510 [Salinimicrobium marinum]|uniref:Uncharacterized protein n=1 Tax=Salinimicrobium marinum TaxID=680283 RepID=A0A918SCZ9_9FLAO|nr:hypothetical protein GCM10007103_13510 [Salinimicrobium marinum]